jgi:hypothetical protein
MGFEQTMLDYLLSLVTPSHWQERYSRTEDYDLKVRTTQRSPETGFIGDPVQSLG